MVNEQDKANIKDLLSCMGSVIELPESEMGMGSELVGCMPVQKYTSIEAEEVVQMVLNTMIGTRRLMIKNNYSYQDVITRVATKGGITEEGVTVIRESFPNVSNSIFDKTLEKRKQTTLNAQKAFKE
jgi:pyrroline-5-carboxylate reductase